MGSPHTNGVFVFDFSNVHATSRGFLEVQNEDLKRNGVKTYFPHPVIRINSDADFTADNGVVAESGTAADPYIIENWEIDTQGSGAAIYIGNTTAYFIVRNCYVYGAQWLGQPYFAGAGIILYNVKNGVLSGNLCTNNDEGIYLCYQCSNNIIENNGCSNNNYEGIHLYSACTNNTIRGNTISNIYYDGIFLDYSSDYNTIESNSVTGCYNGIYLISCSYNEIKYNTFTNNYEGISLNNTCNSNQITNNNCSANTYDGIYLYDFMQL